MSGVEELAVPRIACLMLHETSRAGLSTRPASGLQGFLACRTPVCLTLRNGFRKIAPLLACGSFPIMDVTFPSLEFFRELQALMHREHDRFKKLGYFDTTFGVRIVDAPPGRNAYVLRFEVFECVEVRAVDDLDAASVDFVLEGDLATWSEMLQNIRQHGAADVAHSINTLTHTGERLRVLYDDPDGHDKLYRFAESIQQFFDLAATIGVNAAAEPRRAEA
jgi:hypothetical protein